MLVMAAEVDAINLTQLLAMVQEDCLLRRWLPRTCLTDGLEAQRNIVSGSREIDGGPTARLGSAAGHTARW